MSGETAAAAAATAVAAACTAIAARRAVAPNPRRPGVHRMDRRVRALHHRRCGAVAGSGERVDGGAFRVYYLTGGILVVAYLAVGELLLVLPGRTVTRMAAATMLFLTFAAAAAVLAARVDGAELARAGATPPNDALEGTWPKVMAIALNSVGTVVLLVGSIASARRRRDPRPLLVAAGVAVIAAASTATRAGSYALFALGQAAGITLILLGLVTRRLGPR